MKKTSVYFILSLLFCAQSLSAQTSWSLFWRTDSVQVNRIEAFDNKQYRKVGHHGPTVENSFMALRIYFNDSGAIDVYSKRGPAMELRKYLWYPSEKQQKEENAGCDEYFVDKTVGLGGIKLWYGENEVAVAIGSKRVANAGDTAEGSFAEVITYGVPYKECTSCECISKPYSYWRRHVVRGRIIWRSSNA
jgi:hypothetical protein